MRTTILTPYFRNRDLGSSLWNQMDRFFEDFNTLSSSLPVYDERAYISSPQTDITENEDNFFLSVDLPGMKKEDIKIDVVDNVLTVSGERKSQNQSRTYKRSFTLPTTVDTSKVEARYEDGVLAIYLPKTPAAKPRQIEIQSGKGGVFERLLGSKKETSETEVKLS